MCQRYSEAELDLRSGLAEKSLEIAQEFIRGLDVAKRRKQPKT